MKNVAFALVALSFVACSFAKPRLNSGTTTEVHDQKVQSQEQELRPLVVLLVRHAEKISASQESGLTPEGSIRAQELSRVLADAKLDQVHSTDFVRTKNTALPIAYRLGKQIAFYYPGDLKRFASRLLKKRGRHLVVGHSNTTPELVRLLGGDPGSAIDEKAEHDRLYIITIDSCGAVSTVLIKYGQRN